MDRIYIKDLHLRCIIGVFPEERKDLQDLILNVTMECSFGRAPETDELEDTVDYKSTTKKIIKLVKESEFQLIESIADRVARICLENPRVTKATVCVDKPGALRFARSVAVETTLERGS